MLGHHGMRCGEVFQDAMFGHVTCPHLIAQPAGLDREENEKQRLCGCAIIPEDMKTHLNKLL